MAETGLNASNPDHPGPVAQDRDWRAGWRRLARESVPRVSDGRNRAGERVKDTGENDPLPLQTSRTAGNSVVGDEAQS